MRHQRQVLATAQKWWFIPLIVLPELIPPYAATGYRLQDVGLVNAYILTHPIKSEFAPLYVGFQVVPMLMIGALLIFRNRAARVFSGFVGASCIGMGVLQSVSVDPRYGTAICLGNMLMCFVLAGLWFWEAYQPRTDYRFQARALWLLPLALLAFWEPVNRTTLLPDFNPLYLLTSGTGAVYCMIMPLYMTVLLLQFPRVNIPLLGATSFISILLALGNFLICFVLYPAYWWIGILHVPLLITGVYGFRQTVILQQ